jgi:hypothetical protein
MQIPQQLFYLKHMTISDIPNDDDSKSSIAINGTSPIGSIYRDSTTGASYITTGIGKHSLISSTSPVFTGAISFSYGGSSESKQQSDYTGALETLFKLIDDLQTNICTLQDQVSSLEYKLAEAEKKLSAISEQPLATAYSDGLMSKEDKAKLSTIECWATHNKHDSDLLDRSNHFGFQPIGSIAGLQPILDLKAFRGEK